eukprot:7792402-Alexandrium_andersonii.AAC.1
MGEQSPERSLTTECSATRRRPLGLAAKVGQHAAARSMQHDAAMHMIAYDIAYVTIYHISHIIYLAAPVLGSCRGGVVAPVAGPVVELWLQLQA